MAIDTSQAAITELSTRQSILLNWLTNIQVTNDDEQKNAEDMLIHAKAALKEAEEKRKDLTRPLDESKARIIALFKPYVETLEQGVSALNKALHGYHDKKRIETEAARLTALAEQAARIAAAKDTGEVIEPLAAPIESSVAKTSHAHLGSVTYRDDYDIQIVSPKDVPRDLCEPSMPKIRARVKSGVLDIPGVLIAKKYVSVARTEGGTSRNKEDDDVDRDWDRN